MGDGGESRDGGVCVKAFVACWRLVSMRFDRVRIRRIAKVNTAYWVVDQLLLDVDQSIIYAISIDLDTTYSSKSDNDLEFV
ncbi:hypothetical protein Tco_0037807 [Tanacetum coccineum]